MYSERNKIATKFNVFLNSLKIKSTSKDGMRGAIKPFYSFLAEHEWTLPIDSMATVSEYEIWLESNYAKKSTVKAKVNLAKRFAMFNGAEESDITIAFDNIQQRELSHIRHSASGVVLSDHECLQLKAYTWKSDNERNRAIIAILIDTGLNAVEIATSKKCDLSAETRSLFIINGLRTRFVVFSNQTKLKIAAAGIACNESDDTPLLFDLNVREVTRLVTAASKDINLKIDDPFDVFKRTLATKALFRGIRIEIIAHMLGETVESIMDRYIMARPSDLRYVLDGVLWDSERPGNDIINTIGTHIGI